MEIEVAVHEIHPGPVITRYEVELKKGQRLKTVLGVQQDLSLILGAPVRILSIARKGLVGIEVPNAKRSDIRLRPLIEDGLRNSSRDKEAVRVPMGLTPVGEPFDMDLCRAPHVLVAGTTGSGKSVFLNALVTGLAYGYSTDAVRLVLVDPKMVEFSIYNGLPHLLHPVVTDAAVCGDLLSYLTEEMNRRYRLLAESECRDIRSFRHKAASTGSAGMPYIVVIIDEFADLFLAKTSDLETLIVRLAQKARAIGIHLVMATQRPSTDVVKGLIKANFPSRLAFRVSTGVDSRVILDEEGAESLLGNGDMLLKSPEFSGLQRLHGAYVSQEEIEGVIKFFRDL
jgi:S-DNA-T family DNA segregation ATPase FtsK/SpoIIIE